MNKFNNTQELTNLYIVDYPKLESPFIRKTISRYVCTPEIDENYKWVFEDNGVKAVDKLHGSNHCCLFENGELIAVDNRKTRYLEAPITIKARNTHLARIIEGINTAIEREWIAKDFTGRLYGELIGPTINGNLHKVEKHYFVPFDYLEAKCHWKSWINNKYPKTYEAISEWFKELISLFSQRVLKIETPAEGIIFYHPDGRKCKLRRNMFDWFKEE